MKSSKNLLIIIVLFLCRVPVSAQTNYVLNNGYSVTIHGGSNLHDWDETAGNIIGTGNISWNSNGSFDINAIKITDSLLFNRASINFFANSILGGCL